MATSAAAPHAICLERTCEYCDQQPHKPGAGFVRWPDVSVFTSTWQVDPDGENRSRCALKAWGESVAFGCVDACATTQVRSAKRRHTSAALVDRNACTVASSNVPVYWGVWVTWERVHHNKSGSAFITNKIAHRGNNLLVTKYYF